MKKLDEERFEYHFRPEAFDPRKNITCEVQYSHAVYPPWYLRAWKVVDRRTGERVSLRGGA